MRYTNRLRMLLQGCVATAAIRRLLSLRGGRQTAVAISLLFLLSSFFVTPAFALAAVTTSDTLTLTAGQGILPNSPPTALLGIRVNFSGTLPTTLTIEAAVIDAGGLNIDGSDISRLSIYQDTDGDSHFSSADLEVDFRASPVVPGTPYTLSFSDGVAAGIRWYFIVIKTSGFISHGDAFQGRLVSFNADPGGTSGGPWSDSRTVTCECKVVDIYYTESDTDLFHTHTWDLVANAYETYWKPNYLSYAIAQEMTEPTQIYSLSEARRYSFLDSIADDTDIKAAHSNALKFERRRKLMGMDIPTAVLGIKVAGKNQLQDATYYDSDYFATMVIQFVDTNTANFKAGGGSGTGGQLQSINSTNPALGGVAVYKNNAPFGTFGPEDTVLNILNTSGSGTASGWSSDGQTLTLEFSPPADNLNAAIPQDFDADLDDSTGQDTHDTTGVDFFVVLRGNPDNIAYGADFTAQVTGMDFVGADNPPASPDWYETGEIKAIFELSDYTGTRVDPGTIFPVIGINVNSGAASERLASFNFYLKDTGPNFNPNTDLTGVSVLDRSGAPVSINPPVWSTVSALFPLVPSLGGDYWWATTVTFSPFVLLPTDDDDIGENNAGPEYFVNLTTSKDFGYNKKIIAAIPDEEFFFGSSPDKTSAEGTVLITNANVDHGSNSRSYPDIDPDAAPPINNPILGNPSVVFGPITDTIKKNSDPTAIIGIGLGSNTSSDTPVFLKSMVVQIVDRSSDHGFLTTDLATMDTNPNLSGIGLYLDNGNGVFGTGDIALPLAFPPTYSITVDSEGYYRYLLVLKDPLLLPDGTGVDSIFVTLKTSPTMSSTDKINLRIWGSEIKPCSSYGLGFRGKDDSAKDTEVEDLTYEVSWPYPGENKLTLTSAPENSPPDYSDNWYLVITANGSGAVGQVYKVIGVAGTDVTVNTMEGADYDLSLISPGNKVKFFKVESTSYQNFTTPAPVTYSGDSPTATALTITPDPVGNTGTITLSGLTDPNSDSLTVQFYYTDSAGNNPTDISGTDTYSSPYQSPITYIWNTTAVPGGNYRLFAHISDGVNIGTFPVGGTSFTINHAPLITIIQPATPGLPPTLSLYTITWTDTGLDGGETVALYYDTDNSAGGESPIVTDLLATDNTYSWNTNAIPSGTYYIKGVISDGVWPVNYDYSTGTVTINNGPTATALTIAPTVGENTSLITLSGLTDPDNDNLTVQFYYTNGAGVFVGNISASSSYTYSPLYPQTSPSTFTVTYDWNTTNVPAGDYRLFARISDGVNVVIFPVAGTLFTVGRAAPTGSAVDQVISGQGILPNSPLTAIFGLNLVSTTSDPLTSVQVTFTDVNGDGSFAASDLAEVALYRDSGGAGNEVFDSSDVLLGTAPAPPVGSTTYTIPGGDGSLPKDDALGNAGIDYFIVVRTSNTIDHHDAFYATDTLINGVAIDPGVYNVSSGTVRCECKVVDVFYTQSFHLEDWVYLGGHWGLGLVPDTWNTYWTPNYLSYSIRTEMTEPNKDDPAGDPYPWYLTELGNYRYSYVTGGPSSTSDELTDYIHAYSNLLKFERKRQLLQMQVPTAILGIKVAGKDQYQSETSEGYDGDYLNALVIDFTDTDSVNFNARDMLYPLNVSDEVQSGVALYRDNNHNGILDEGDQPVPLYNNNSAAQWSPNGNRVTFNFSAEVSALSRIPQTYDAEGGGDSDTVYPITYLHDRTGTDFLVVIRARPQTTQDLTKIKYGADFTAKVTTLTFTGGTGLSSPTRGQWYSTKEIKAVLELSDLTGSRVDPNSTFPVIGINVVDGPGLYEKIYKITFQLKEEVGFDPNIDISGASIYQDDGSEAGIFDPNDTIVAGLTRSDWVLVVTPTGSWWETTISAVPGLDVPDNDNSTTDTGIDTGTDTGLYQGDDYYLVLQTSENFGYLDKITGRILDGGIEFSGTTKSTSGTGLTTNALLPPVSNTRVHWDPFASPETPLPGNVAVKFHDLIITPFLEAGPDPAAILGLELSSNTVSDTQPVLKSLVVQLINRTTDKNYFDMNDLSAMTTDSNTSGLGVWKDNGDGVFDASVDEALTMAAPPTQYAGTGAENYQRFIIVLDKAQSVDKSFSPSGYPDYFVTIKARDENASDQLLMRLWGSEMKPPASYSLGFRAKNTALTDTVSATEAVLYGVENKTTTPTSTLTLNPALGGSWPDYNQNWYLVVTGNSDTAKGAVKKILGYDSATKTITCEDLTGLGSITQIRVFKLDSTSYQNHSVDIAFKRKSSVTLSASSTTTTIVLTWVDDTPGGGARTFDIERRLKESVSSDSSWTKIESDLSSASPKLKVVGINTYQYIDVPPGTITYEYRVTVKQSGTVDVFSNIVSAKLSSYFLYRPTDLHYSVGINAVDLDWYWQDGYKINESGFSVERKGKNEPEAGWSVIGSTSEYPLDNFGRYTDRSITDSMLETEATYDYRVRAFKDIGIWTVYSDYSDPIEVQVLPSSVIPNSGGGGGGAVGPLALGISALLGWWKRRRQRRR